jgi:hypothetical protein
MRLSSDTNWGRQRSVVEDIAELEKAQIVLNRPRKKLRNRIGFGNEKMPWSEQ